MRDVHYGWLIRYLHANVASFFFIFVYLHIGRGLYYGSYRSPRVLLWSIGVIILVLMMAFLCGQIDVIDVSPLLANYDSAAIAMSSMLPFSKPRTWATKRIGPHSKEILDIIICGMLGDWWSNLVPSKTPSPRFEVEQAMSNSLYIQFLADTLFRLGYVASTVLKLVTKSEGAFDRRTNKTVVRQNWRLTTFTYLSLLWIHEGFYPQGTKIVPAWVTDYISPLGLAHWIMQDGSRQIGQSVYLATNSFTYADCLFLANFLATQYGLKASVVKTGVEGQWRIAIWKESMPLLRLIVGPHMHPSMLRKLI